MSFSPSGTERRDPAPESIPPEQNMRANTVSLILASLLTGLLGLAFWGVAGRMYPAHQVGVAAAVITSALVLSGLSILSVDTIYERFLPLAGTRTGSMLKQGFLLVSVTALMAGAGLVAFGPRHKLFESGWQMACYPLLVMVFAVFALQDKATLGLGVARWSAAMNSLHAAAKLAVLLLLAWTGSALSIVAAWGATAVAAALFIMVAMRRRYRSHPQFLEPPNLPPANQLWSYYGSSFGLSALWSIGPLVVPLIVLSRFGATANAHFVVTWAIINALYFAVHLVMSPFVAEVAANPGKVASLSVRMVQIMVAVACVASVGLVLVGPYLLAIVGADYRLQGQGLLSLAAVFIPLSAVGAVYEGFARVQRKLRLMIVVQSIATVLIVGGSLLSTRVVGVVGVGWAYLAAEAVSAVILLPPVIVWFRRAQSQGLDLNDAGRKCA